MGKLWHVWLGAARRMQMLIRQNFSPQQYRALFISSLDRVLYALNLRRPCLQKILEPVDAIDVENEKILFIVHIFYSEYAPSTATLIRDVRSVYRRSAFLVTSPSNELLKQVSDLVDTQTDQAQSVSFLKVPNVGRNIGPLFVCLSSLMDDFTFVTHLHSKKSTQYGKTRGLRWGEINWQLLGGDRVKFSRALRLLKANPSLGFVFALDWKLTPPSSFGWGVNSRIGKELVSRIGAKWHSGKFMYPAGGMFLAKADALQPIVDLGLRYQDFPPETGQLDGTIQHALERLIGTSTIHQGYSGVALEVSTDGFVIFCEEG